MLDRDLAILYGVSTGRLNEQVKRNIKRFPAEFMFQLTKEEFDNLISQFAISRKGGTRKLPYVFTEYGIAMLSSILNSERAIQINIRIIKAFIRMRQAMMNYDEIRQLLEEMKKKYDCRFKAFGGLFEKVFEDIKIIYRLLDPIEEPKEEIGFRDRSGDE